MTPETRVTTGGISTRPIAFLIPIVLTIILLFRNKIIYNKNFYKILFVLILWSFIQICVKQEFDIIGTVNYFYIVYAYFMAYIHCRVFGKKMFPLYERIIVVLAKISLLVWGFSVVLPGIVAQISNYFPKTGYGYNILYIINLMDPNGAQVTNGIIRNAGCSWEPGRYAIMLCLAIMINLYTNGIKFKKNKNIVWLLLALLTTMSTTGYILCAILYLYFYIKRISIKYVFGTIIIGIPLFLLGLQISFIGNKLKDKLNVKEDINHIEYSWQWTEEHNEKDGVAYSMDRFPSMYYEFQNFIKDPIIGYGGNVMNSFFYQTYTSSLGFTGGLVQVFSKHGIILGILFFLILYKSSKKISCDLKSSKYLGVFIYSLISMISYPLLWQNLYTALWFYGIFNNKENENNSCYINRS